MIQVEICSRVLATLFFVATYTELNSQRSVFISTASSRACNSCLVSSIAAQVLLKVSVKSSYSFLVHTSDTLLLSLIPSAFFYCLCKLLKLCVCVLAWFALFIPSILASISLWLAFISSTISLYFPGRLFYQHN
jgi:hypothetical protein